MAQIPLHDYLEEIDTLIDESRLGEAVAHCRQILEHYPRYVGAYRLLGKALLEQNAFADAANVFRRVLSADPEDFLAHVGLAIVHKQKEAYIEALWHMERAFEQEPYNAAIQDELKELYGRRDGLAPEQVPLTRGALARLYVKGELYQQAVAELRDLLAGEPNRLDLQSLLAEALWRDGRRVDAVDLCQDILSRLPLCVRANAIVAEVWLLTGREEEAQEFLRRLRQLTQLARDQLRGDSPAVRAFRADGAIPLPEQVLVERLPEEKAFGAAEGAGWVQEIDFEGDEALDDDFDWLEALQTDQEEADPEAASPEDEEEVMDWLRDVAAQGDATGDLVDPAAGEDKAAVDESGWLAEPESPEEGEKAVTDDLPDWFDEVDDRDIDLDDTADWFSDSAAGDAGFDEEMEWEAWMASGQEEASVDDDVDWLAEVSDAAGEAEPAPESAFAVEDDSLPDWLQDEEEAAAAPDEAGPLMEQDVPPEDAPDEQLQVEEVPMGTTDDHANEWEELPDNDAHQDERPEAKESAPDEDLDWLDELKEAGEEVPAGPSDEDAAPAGDLPDWLSEEMEEAAAAGETLDWLEEASGDDGPLDDEAEAFPVDDMPDWLQEEDEGADADAGREEEAAPADDDLSWLDQIAAGVGEPIEEGPTLEWPETESGDSERPADLPREEDASPESVDDVPQKPEGDPEIPEIAEGATEDVAAGGPGDAPSEAPEDLDDAMDWLEQMAADEEPADEPDVAAAMEAETGLDWLDDLAVGEDEGEEEWPETPSPEESPLVEEAAEAPAEIEGETPADEEAGPIEEIATAEQEEADSLDWLDDLDEVAAEDAGHEEDWLEDLPEDEDLVDAGELDSLLGAAEAGAEETQPDEETPAGEEAAEEPTAEVPVTPEEAVAPEEPAAPEEPVAQAPETDAADELDWLDEMAADEAAPEDEDLVGEQEVESLLAASEEAPRELGDELAEGQAEDISDVPEDLDEAMAWLERLAAQQGASLDELPSLKEAAGEEELSETEEVPDWMDELDVEEVEVEPHAEAEAGAPPEMDVTEDTLAAEEDLEWLDDLVSEEADEEDVDWLADEETADPEAAAEMEAAVDENLSWLDDLETEEAPPEAAAQPETQGDVDEAMAWLEELAAEEEVSPEGESTAEPAADEAIAGLSDEIPDDPDEALSWLEQLAGAEAPKAPETPVVEEQSTPAAPQDVVEARAQAEAAALREEKSDAEEEREEAEAGDAAGYEEEEVAPLETPLEEVAEAGEEAAEPALEAPAVDEIETAEDLELFAEDAGLDIPEDPDEAMAWLERLAARQGASLDELPTVETAEEEVETPAWIAREMEETAAEEAPSVEEAPSDEAVAPDEAVVPEEAEVEEAAFDEIEEIVFEEAVDEEPPAEEVVAEEAPSEEPAPVDESLPETEIEEPEPAAPSEPEPEPAFADDLDDDFLGDLTEEDFDDSLPDWLKGEEGTGFGWGDAEPNVTGWLQAEEEATQYDLEIPEVPADWDAPEDVEPVVAEEPSLPVEEVPTPEPLSPAAALDLDQERLESARAALEGGDHEAAVSDYRALLDAGEGLNALVAELESQVATHESAATLRELLGDTYMRNGQLQKALDTYRQALDQL